MKLAWFLVGCLFAGLLFYFFGFWAVVLGAGWGVALEMRAES